MYRAMASTEALTRLKQNAAKADQIINDLKVQLQALQQTAAAKACQVESEHLVKENATLRLEVDLLKQELVSAEVKHGVLQVPMPNRKSATPVAAATAPAVATQKVVSNVDAEQRKPLKTDNNLAQNVVKAVKEPAQPKSAKAEKKSASQPAAAATSESTTAAAAPPGGGGETVDVSRLNMRIGRIVDVKKHPDADSLYVEEVDVGEAKHRTIVSGLVKHVPLEQMQSRVAVFLLNLKPAKMRGITSEGMIMCASSPEKVEIIVPPEGVAIGDRVAVEGYPGGPDEQLNPKKKTWEQIQPELRINAAGLATYKGALWKIEGKDGVFRAPTMVDSAIR
jgi:aminoacyl tRNA synthase complex-interacting multifunctional protein 1